MRRSLLMTLGAMVLALVAPSVALAHHGRGHHHHHKAKAKAHHAQFRIVHIGATAIPPASTPTPTPTTPTAPPMPENAGTVVSYTGGVLILTLNDGSTVSGKVTEDTRIGCIKATPMGPPTGTGPQPPTDQGPGDDNGQGDDQSRGDMNQQGDQGHGDGEWQHGDQGDDDDENPGASEPPCDSSALVPGAVVRAAELRIGPGGTEFENILLVR